MFDQLDSWHQTKTGFLVFGLVELAIAYGFGSLAIDRGNFWWYLFGLIFLFGALSNLIRLIGAVFHVSRPKR